MEDPLLLAVGALIRKEINAGGLLQRVVEVTSEAVSAERGSIFLFDQTGEELVSIAGHLPEVDEIRVPIGKGVAGYVARTEQIVNVPYRDGDAWIWREIDHTTGYTTRTILAGPLHDRDGRLIGVLEFLNKSGGAFDRQDEERFHTLAQQVSRVLHQTTLAHGPNYVLPEERGRGAAEEPAPPKPHPVNDPPLNERFNGVVGASPAMQSVFRHINKVAPTEATVLLRGPSGTGKGRIARAIHHNSNRRDGPFIHIDCTTLPEGLMENELFGHERGAYTGAQQRQQGKVELAAGGTIFLDEIGDMPVGLQSKLLTVLQDRIYTRLGGSETLKADIRVLAATNRDLEGMVAEGRFREDLYYRLRVVEITMPTLRERGDADIIRLTNHFIGTFANRYGKTLRGIRADAMTMLLEHRWPGNVRELEHCIESAVIFANEQITPSTLSLPRRTATREMRAVQLPRDFGVAGPPAAAPATPGYGAPTAVDYRSATPSHDAASLPNPEAEPFSDQPSLRELESRYIAHLLQSLDGNRSACARVLNIGRNTLARKIKEYDLGHL